MSPPAASSTQCMLKVLPALHYGLALYTNVEMVCVLNSEKKQGLIFWEYSKFYIVEEMFCILGNWAKLNKFVREVMGVEQKVEAWTFLGS